MLLPTTEIGSFPQPDWLLDKAVLRSQRVPRVRQPGLWKVGDEDREEAIADATLGAIRAMESAGIDIVTDGEIGRESYSNHFLADLEGVDLDTPVTIQDGKGRDVFVPRVTGKIARTSFVERDAAIFLRDNTKHQTKVTLPGPFTLAQQCHDEYYKDREELAFAFGQALNEEAKDLAALGINVVQFDEPWFRNDTEGARRYGVKLLNQTIQGVNTTTALHMCFGYGFLVPGEKPKEYEYLGELADSGIDQISVEAAQSELNLEALAELAGKTIMLGVLDLSSDKVETVDAIAERIRSGLKWVSADRLMPAPDCGMKYLSRNAAMAKLANLAQAAAQVREEIA